MVLSLTSFYQALHGFAYKKQEVQFLSFLAGASSLKHIFKITH